MHIYECLCLSTCCSILPIPEPGYVATPLIFVELAKCLMEERESLPIQGGVCTPAAVFYESTLIDRLKTVGIDFSVLESN